MKMALAVLLCLAAAGCSVLLDTGAPQCRSDVDCMRFGNAVCNFNTKLCVPKAPITSMGQDAGVDMGGPPPALCHDETGCIPCPDQSPPTFLDSCTDTQCVAFDNSTRLLNLDQDGKLKPLPQ